MDADLIRLILLILGVCLVAGIWLWDRWQRGQGEPPMVRMRDETPEEDLRDEAAEWQESDASEAGAFDDDDADPDSDREPDTAEPSIGPMFVDVRDVPEPDEASADDAPLDAPAVARPRVQESSRKPTGGRADPPWVRPAEPVIPAFLIRSDSELLDDPTPSEPAPATAVVSTEETDHADHRRTAELVPPVMTASLDDEPALPVLELAPEPIETAATPRTKKTNAAAPKPDVEPVTIRHDEDQFDLDLGFSAVDDQDLQEVAVDLPDLIVQINIVARGEPFSGEQVQAAMEQVEMRAGEHDIYHRYDNRAAKGKKPKSLFSLASLVEPGNFPLKKMRDFATPGLTLFTQLPGPRDGLLIYSDMLYVAERLARLLDARLKDENRSTLTKQTIEHTRERIAEHKRQITLKLRQASEQQRGRR